MDKENLNGIPEEEKEEIIICSRCGANEAMQGSEYCEQCEAQLLKKKIPFFGWVAGFVSLMLSVVVTIVMLSGTVLTSGLSKGDKYADEKSWHTAYEQYYNEYKESVASLNVINDLLNRVFETEERAYVSPSLGIKKKMINVVANYYGPLDAYYYATGFLSENEMAMPFMKNYEKMYLDFQTTYQAAEATFNKAFEENADYKTVLAEMDTHKGKDGVNEVFLNYHKYVISVNLGASVSEQNAILEDIRKAAEASGDDYGWLLNPVMSQAHYDAGEIDKAMACLDKIIDSNKSNYDAYRLKMRLQVKSGDIQAAGETVAEFRAANENCEFTYYADVLEIEYLRITGDYDKAKALCIEADESYKKIPEDNGIFDLIYMIEGKYVMPTEIYRQRALVSMITEDYADAFNTMMEAYQMESYYAQYFQGSANLNDPNFYGALYLSANLLSSSGQMTEESKPDVDIVLSMFSEGAMSKDIEAIINGEKTAKEVLTEGEFELV